MKNTHLFILHTFLAISFRLLSMEKPASVSHERDYRCSSHQINLAFALNDPNEHLYDNLEPKGKLTKKNIDIPIIFQDTVTNQVISRTPAQIFIGGLIERHKIYPRSDQNFRNYFTNPQNRLTNEEAKLLRELNSLGTNNENINTLFFLEQLKSSKDEKI